MLRLLFSGSELCNFYDVLSSVPLFNIRHISHNRLLQLQQWYLTTHPDVQSSEGGGPQTEPGGAEGEDDNVRRSHAGARPQVPSLA